MTARILSDNLPLTDALKEYSSNKLKKLECFDITKLKCLLKVDGRDHIVEITADDIFIKVTGIDMYSSITKAVNIMKLALSDRKDKQL